MKSIGRRIIMAGLAVPFAVTAGIAWAGAASGTPHTTTHTLKFIAVTTNMSTPTKSGAYYEADVDVNPATRTSPSSTRAQDVLSCVAGSTKVWCSAALADAHGILDAVFTVKESTGALSGMVTGGTGSYAGAKGTVHGTPSTAGEAVTITYTT